MPSRRRLARVAAMQTVFAMQAREVDPTATLKKNEAELGGKDAVDLEYAKILVEGVAGSMDKIKESILTHAPQWPWDRMDSITRSILLVGTFELLYAQDLPPAVAMNEAIEVAKEYGSDESAKFVNGVLNAIAHRAK